MFRVMTSDLLVWLINIKNTEKQYISTTEFVIKKINLVLFFILIIFLIFVDHI